MELCKMSSSDSPSPSCQYNPMRCTLSDGNQTKAGCRSWGSSGAKKAGALDSGSRRAANSGLASMRKTSSAFASPSSSLLRPPLSHPPSREEGGEEEPNERPGLVPGPVVGADGADVERPLVCRSLHGDAQLKCHTSHLPSSKNPCRGDLAAVAGEEVVPAEEGDVAEADGLPQGRHGRLVGLQEGEGRFVGPLPLQLPYMTSGAVKVEGTGTLVTLLELPDADHAEGGAEADAEGGGEEAGLQRVQLLHLGSHSGKLR